MMMMTMTMTMTMTMMILLRKQCWIDRCITRYDILKTNAKSPLPLVKGFHPPETMMNFALFQISHPISEKKFRLHAKFPQFHFFAKPFLDFHLSKFLMTCFSHWLKSYNSLFSLDTTFLPIWGKLLFPPYFLKFPPDFVKFTFFELLCAFRFPPSLTMMHLCMMHSCMHVLDAPALGSRCRKKAW